ncbi:MAG: hypothetical protein J6D21_04790 [Clostridia bacterium]|nr:hypothetical protein [Clostridia bacterium]
MAENRACGTTGGFGSGRETVCIDTYRVLDSCRDKDCFENVRVYLTNFGQEIIERTSNIRSKCAKIVCADIDVENVPFNRGFYQLSIRIHIKITFEACMGQGNIQEFEGVAVTEKKVVLFGGEGSVNIFRSEVGEDGFCKCPTKKDASSNLPIAIMEAVDPIVLSTKVVEPAYMCGCCCCLCDIPDSVLASVNGNLMDYSDNRNKLIVSIGIFSVIRLQRPAQYLISATQYCVPDKECVVAEEENPCALFRNMIFPINEFCPPSVPHVSPRGGDKPCGCS